MYTGLLKSRCLRNATVTPPVPQHVPEEDHNPPRSLSEQLAAIDTSVLEGGFWSTLVSVGRGISQMSVAEDGACWRLIEAMRGGIAQYGV